MSFWQTFKLRKMVRRFKKGFMLCEQCRTRYPLKGLVPLSFMQCRRCGYLSLVPLQVADYWLYQPLGGGGLGSVYLAYWRRGNARCAVKVLQMGEENNERAVSGLQREADVLARIGKHPCIVSLINSGFANDRHFLAMEFIDGERLDFRIARFGEIAEQEALHILLCLLAAEKHIYRTGHLYGDMKPQNIIIRKRNVPVMIDFGLCMPLDDASVQNKESFVGGSPYYLPPERLQRGAEGPCSEIYSMGMLMFSMLTGDTFFKFSGNVQDLAMKHVQTARLPVNPDMMPQCSPAVAEMVGQMIRKEPEDRFQTFEEVEDAAVRCLQSRSVRAKR
jgi:eukaryotic-like serine/threonine-protein kinase